METNMPSARTPTGHRLKVSAGQWRTIARDLHMSARELQIGRRIFDGKNEATIARELGISTHTVHTYIRRLYRKLGVRDRCELLMRLFAEYVSLRPHRW